MGLNREQLYTLLMPYDECDPCELQICTNKNIKPLCEESL